MTDTASAGKANPLLQESPLPLQFPPFDRITADHFMPAFERGMEEHLEEIADIAGQADEPDFENTMARLERSGQTLERVAIVFYALSAADTSDAIDAIEVEIAPQLSAHRDQILLNERLFARVKHIHESRHDLGLDAEALRLVEERYKDFLRAGAELGDTQKTRLREINRELAELSTRFSQNVLEEVNALAVVVDSREELAGLTEARIQAASDEAESRGIPGKFVLPLVNTSGQPVLSSLHNRALRQRICETSLSRGHRGGEFDNREILSRMARLRAERAQLLGFENHASYILEAQTAKTVDAVNARLAELVRPAIANAKREAADLQALVDAEGGDFELAAWDWDYYAEKLRQQRFAFDEAQLRPYLEVNNVLENGVFYAANRVYGLTFEERFDLPVFHDDMRVFEVFDADGSTLSLLLVDPYARPSKKGGAWMNHLVYQSQLRGTQPVVGNYLNIAKAPAGEPTLMTFREVTTMFHEFGHALHGMFSGVTYPWFSGTRVPRDFVEYPSQVNEMWADWTDVLANYARHCETGEPMPPELLDKVRETRQFNEGFATSEYLMASITDQALHQLAPGEVPAAEEIMEFERRALEQAGAYMEEIPPRYRLSYFSHITGGYSAGYYAYIWAEVLDADTVDWFRENGGMSRENGQRFREAILSRGGSVEAMELFRRFRGREPDVQPLLERRGLAQVPQQLNR